MPPKARCSFPVRETLGKHGWWTAEDDYGNIRKFQWDYRNGITWFSYDPSKWIISILSFLNLAENLKKAKDYMIWESKISSIRDRLNERFSQSTKVCRNFYRNKIDQLDEMTKVLFLNWNKMEMKYANMTNLNGIEGKVILKNIKKERQQYREQIIKIQKHLNMISSSVRSNSLNPRLIV